MEEADNTRSRRLRKLRSPKRTIKCAGSSITIFLQEMKRNDKNNTEAIIQEILYKIYKLGQFMLNKQTEYQWLIKASLFGGLYQYLRFLNNELFLRNAY